MFVQHVIKENGEIKRADVWKLSHDPGSFFVDHVLLADEFDCFADWLEDFKKAVADFIAEGGFAVISA